ncbi:MAG: PqqD family protein [Deltaproteobacteria bacterium]|jgi:hypothetical protein
MPFDLHKLQQYAISANGLIFDPETGSIFTTNQTGLSILNHLKAGLDPDQVKERLAEEYEVPTGEVLDHDLNDFLNQLLSLHIVQENDG